MKERIWDKEGKYLEGVLKEYENWILEVRFKRATLGSFIIFAKRDVERISELNSRELEELVIVMKDVETALSKIFKPDIINYLQLGNNEHRLHFHGIPRYASPREFNGNIWTDGNFGRAPSLYAEEISVEDVVKIRDILKTNLGK